MRLARLLGLGAELGVADVAEGEKVRAEGDGGLWVLAEALCCRVAVRGVENFKKRAEQSCAT